ncbi:MAG: condensation domain-containing protein, partial [Trebonia sp.]
MAASEGELWKLTSAQLGVWYAQQLEPSSPVYNIGDYTELRGDLNVGLFTDALRLALDEAESYRLRLRVVDGIPRQYIGDRGDYQVEVVDLRADSEPREAAERWMRTDLNHAVDLTAAPLYAHAVLRLSDDHVIWYQRVHHVVIDGAGRFAFARRVAEIYDGLAEGGAPSGRALGPIAVLLEADQEYRESGEYGQDRDFWLGALSGVPEAVGWRGHPARRLAGRPVQHWEDISAAHAAWLREGARRLRTNVAALVAAAAAVYRYRVAGADDIVLGVAVNGRMQMRELGIPGMTANYVPVRLIMTGASSVADVVREAARGVREGLRHQRYPYTDIPGDLGLVAVGQLYDALVNVIHGDHPARFGGCAASWTGFGAGPVDDLRINVHYESATGGIQTAVELNRDVYGEETGEEVSRRFLRVLNWMAAASPEDPVSAAELLDEAEREQIVSGWNDPGVELGPVTLPGLFAGQAALVPDAVAVVCGGELVSYAELEVRAGRLAGYLRGLGVGRESVVGVSLPRGVEMVVALLAVWMAGGAYLPVDPELP